MSRIPYQFGCDCDGMVQAIRRAANPTVWNGWSPDTDMTREEEAIWFAKYVMRKARTLGLYDSSEPEADRIALGVQRRTA